MNWLWGIWAGIVTGMFVLVAFMERSAIRARINGGNGMILFSTLIVSILGSLLVVVITWIVRDVWTALRTLVAAGAGIALLFASAMGLLNHAIAVTRKADGR